MFDIPKMKNTIDVAVTRDAIATLLFIISQKSRIDL